MSTAPRLLGFVLVIIATIGCLVATIYREWRRNSFQSSQANFVGLYAVEGLWVRCTSPVPGQMQCDEYDTALIGIPAYLQAMRALMVLSCICGFLSSVVTIFGLPCINSTTEGQKVNACRVGGLLAFLAAELTAQRAMMCIAAILAVGALVAGTVGLECVKVMEGSSGKVWAGRSGGGMMMLAGALCLSAVSWYAAQVIYEFFDPLQQNNSFKYEFGASLYVGWVASGLAIISGILLACCTCGQNEDNEAPYNYTYKPPQKAANPNRTEYV